MATCPDCCPHGGAIFRMGFGWRGEAQDNYAMTCQNCGYQRKVRGPNKKSVLFTYDYVTKEATTDEGMSAANRIRFACFNPNGVYAKLKKMHGRLDQWLAAHPERPNGVLFVHGSLCDFPRENLFAALDAPKKRKNVSATINYAIRRVEQAIRDGDEFINTPEKWPAPKQVDADA